MSYRRGRGARGKTTSSSGPAPIRQIDFSTPAVQDFTTAADSSQSHIWGFQEASGNVLDLAGSTPLVPTNTPLQNQSAVIWTGDWDSRKAGENLTGGSNAGFQVATSATLDVGNQATSICIEVVFRMRRKETSTRTLVWKRNSTSGAGYAIDLTGSQGYLRFTATGSATKTLTLSKNHADGAWHKLRCVIDVTGDLVSFQSDLVARSQLTSLAGDFTSTDKFGIFGASTNSNTSPEHSQVTHVEAWEGAAAEARDGADLGFAHGSDPNTGDDALTTKTHTTVLSTLVGDDATLGEFVSHWAGNTGLGDQLPMTYDPNIASGASMGLACFSAASNKGRSTEDLATWTTSGSTQTANDANAPDGMRNADKWDGSGASYIESAASSASGTHIQSIWLRGNTSKNIVAQMRDSGGLVQQETFAVTAKWKRYFILGSVTTTCTLRLYNSSGSNTSFGWGYQLQSGSQAWAYREATTSNATIGDVDYKIANALPVETAEVQLTFLMPDTANGTGSDRTLIDTPSNQNRRNVEVTNSSGNWAVLLQDGFGALTSGTNLTPGPTADTEHVLTAIWEYGRQDFLLDAVSFHSDTDTGYDTGSGNQELDVGYDGAAQYLMGYLIKYVIYDTIVTL